MTSGDETEFSTLMPPPVTPGRPSVRKITMRRPGAAVPGGDEGRAIRSGQIRAIKIINCG
ncbi:hypothetical protein GCM10010417_00450 [Streptomyces carpaticus]